MDILLIVGIILLVLWLLGLFALPSLGGLVYIALVIGIILIIIWLIRRVIRPHWWQR
jgi:hypothetical protein